MTRQSLSGRLGAGLDPCAALQVPLDLAPDQEVEVTFLIGQVGDVVEMRRLVRLYRDSEQVERSLAVTRSWWDNYLGTIQVDTPDLSTNFLLNRWLPYQT